MSGFSIDSITSQFYSAAVNYSTAIQPYALKLFFALFLLEIIATWIQYAADGQLDPSYFFGRLIKHILTGGFVYMMILNGFNWMYLVIQSFSQIGAAISGLPALSPQSVLQAGLNMASTLLNSPAGSGVISNIEEALTEWFCATVVAAAFVIVAVELLLTLVKAYLATGLGVIMLGFGGNRFTASAAEGYFTNVIRIGVKLLFYYAVLAIAMQMVGQWQAALAAACNPVNTTVPMITSYYVPPSAIVTTVCSGSIPATAMLGYAALAAVFAAVTVAVPSMAADLVGGTVGLALAHAFEAVFIARTVVQPITAALQMGLGKLGPIGSAVTTHKSDSASWVNAMDFGRQTQKLNNLGPDGGFRVPAPADVRATSVIPPRAAKTTAVNPGGGNSTTPIGKPTNKI
ncbi:MAG: P-type conjugative transfer protein TrbL [Candidatus Binataceae bacterium]